jgi:hypothetical protein
VGGTPGYEEYLAVLADPEHEEHDNMLQWRGPFDPETFSPAQVNQGLRKKFRLCAGIRRTSRNGGFLRRGYRASLRGCENTTGRAFWDGLDTGFIGRRLMSRTRG